MTCYPFERKNTSKILISVLLEAGQNLHSGYTFKFIEKNTIKLLAHAKEHSIFKF